MSAAYAWKKVYEEAILETDRYRLQERVAAAQAAIDVRLNELSQDGQAAGEEQIAIRDALNRTSLHSSALAPTADSRVSDDG